ncbi:MAG: sodium:solute symporter family protein [Symploca sp. SIO3E6]|nr:sodium:solute symporter family protein [Caldora sp. SIO3E6]
MSVTTLTIAVVIAYLLIVKIVAYLAHTSSTQTVEEYFIAGRNVGIIALVGTIVATEVNALAFTATPAFVYEGGILVLQLFVGSVISLWLFLHFGPRIWQICQEKKFITQAELFGDHYQSRTIYLLTVIIGLISVFPLLIVQFAAVAKVFSTATGNLVTYSQSVLLLAISTGIYVFFGGARAVIWTDLIQGLFFLTLLMITASLFTIWAGGFGQGIVHLTAAIPDKLIFNSENTRVLVDRLLSWPFSFFLWPQVFQRIMMGRSGKVVSQAAWGQLWVTFIVKIALLIMGVMATATLYGQIEDSDRLVAEMFSRNMPLGSAAIVVAIFACGMSSIDSILLSVASIFERDLLEKLLPRPLSEESRYRLAQTISVITLVVVSGLALSEVGSGHLASTVTFGATLASFLLWPLIGMFDWAGSTKAGVISAICFGLGAFCILNIVGNFFSFSIFLGNTTITFIVSLLSFITVSFLTRWQEEASR